eukprot:5911876-Prorocentrum_lima.AAC.1
MRQARSKAFLGRAETCRSYREHGNEAVSVAKGYRRRETLEAGKGRRESENSTPVCSASDRGCGHAPG